MKETLQAETSISMNATPAEVWKALTSPKMVKQYLMGTDVSTDWKEGSPIEYSGEYEGKKYKDKGVIKKIEPEKTLQTTYWSSMRGKPDTPENYNLVTYKISSRDDKTVLTITQDNIQTEQEKEHTTENWKMVLKKIKELLEDK